MALTEIHIKNSPYLLSVGFTVPSPLLKLLGFGSVGRDLIPRGPLLKVELYKPNRELG